MTTTSPGVDPAATREILRRLRLDVTLKLDGLLHGDYRGLVPGQGSELGETREYEPGDDVRSIDWNVTARLSTPHVRDSIADRELETTVLVDLSPSLDFGTALSEKRDLVVSIVGAVGMISARGANRIGAVLLEPGSIRQMPSRQGHTHLFAILHQIASAPRRESGTVDLGEGLRRLGARARRRGFVVVVSDFMAGDDWGTPMRHLALRHDVLAVEVVDPRELELPDVGVIALTDPETGAIREIDTRRRRTRERYAEAAREQRLAIAAGLESAGVEHLRLSTDSDWLSDLVRHVLRRRARLSAVSRSR